MLHLIAFISLFLCITAYSQTITNAIVYCQISYSTNGTDWISTNIFEAPVTNFDTGFYRSITQVIPLINNQTDISSAIFFGPTVTNINTMVGVNYFIVDSTNVSVKANMLIAPVRGAAPTNDCTEGYWDTISGGSGITPPNTVFHCLDGQYVFNFGVG